MSSANLTVLRLVLPPANMGKRIGATFLDLTLVFFLSLFIIGKLWIPVYYADVIVQFKILLESYAETLKAGQFVEFFNALNTHKPIIDMFASIDRLLFLITWGYYTLNALFLQGNTLGKQVFNLRTLKLSNLKPPTLWDSILRSGILTFFLFTAWPFFMVFNLCFICINKLHRGIHDWFCQTYVVCYNVIDTITDQVRQSIMQQNKTEE